MTTNRTVHRLLRQIDHEPELTELREKSRKTRPFVYLSEGNHGEDDFEIVQCKYRGAQTIEDL